LHGTDTMTCKPLALAAILPSLIIIGCGSASRPAPDSTGAAGSGAAGATAGSPGAAGHGSAGSTGVGGAGGSVSGNGGAGGHGSSGAAGDSGGRGGAAGAGRCVCPVEIIAVPPACGADGKTYSNACEAGCAGVAVAHQGTCTDGGSDGPPAPDAGGTEGGRTDIRAPSAACEPPLVMDDRRAGTINFCSATCARCQFAEPTVAASPEPASPCVFPTVTLIGADGGATLRTCGGAPGFSFIFTETGTVWSSSLNMNGTECTLPSFTCVPWTDDKSGCVLCPTP
jgi:hypothetical protein